MLAENKWWTGEGGGIETLVCLPSTVMGQAFLWGANFVLLLILNLFLLRFHHKYYHPQLPQRGKPSSGLAWNLPFLHSQSNSWGLINRIWLLLISPRVQGERFRSKIGILSFNQFLPSYLPTYYLPSHITAKPYAILNPELHSEQNYHFYWLLGFSPVFMSLNLWLTNAPTSGHFLGKFPGPWVTASQAPGSRCPLPAFLCDTTHSCPKLLTLCPLGLWDLWTLHLRKSCFHSFHCQ